MVKPAKTMTADGAATLALQALGFLAADQEAFGRFAGLSGLDPASAGRRAAEPEFLTAVLDFLLADEVLLTGFCSDFAIDPRAVHRARYVLGGP